MKQAVEGSKEQPAEGSKTMKGQETQPVNGDQNDLNQPELQQGSI